MAVYKKKAYKKAKKVEQKIEDESLVAKSLTEADSLVVKIERFLEKYQNKIFLGIGIIALAVVGYYYYHSNVVIPKQQKAANDLYPAQALFEKALATTDPDEQKTLFQKALEGDGAHFGFLDIIDEYGSTPSGKLAHYYAGVSYYHLGQFDKAIEELSKFKAKDEILRPMALGLIGDSFLQLNQPEDALDYFEQAARFSDNEFTAPMFLFKAGRTALEIYQSGQDKKYLDKAEKYFKEIVEDYPQSNFVGDAKLYLAQVEQLK